MIIIIIIAPIIIYNLILILISVFDSATTTEAEKDTPSCSVCPRAYAKSVIDRINYSVAPISLKIGSRLLILDTLNSHCYCLANDHAKYTSARLRLVGVV